MHLEGWFDEGTLVVGTGHMEVEHHQGDEGKKSENAYRREHVNLPVRCWRDEKEDEVGEGDG